MFFKPKIKVVTHDGSFHADEVLAVAALSIWAEINDKKLEVMRSRDPKIVEKADFVVDVGMQYDPEKNRFDHHQKGGAGTRENGIPYASFGLVWKHFGEQICESSEVAKMVEEKLVISVDTRDNGVTISKPNELGIFDHRTHDMLCNFNPTWQEDQNTLQEQFEKALFFAKEIIKREIAYAKAEIEGEKITKEAIKKQNNPEILILDKYTDWEKAASESKNTKFVVYKHRNEKDWCVQSPRDDLEDYNSSRATLPKEWAGLREEELIKVSGILGATFCTNGLWFAVAKTREAAFQMAQIALKSS